jgi:hypothetical protein
MFDTCSFKPTNDGFPPSSGGGGGAVTSVFGRTGVVIAVAGDYTSTQITNDSGVPGYGTTVTDAITSIFYTKLENTLTSANIIVGNGSNVATPVAMSGDATISNTGALTISNQAVTFAKMQHISSQHLVGRHAAGSGDIQQISLGTGLSFSGANLQVTGYVPTTLTSANIIVGNNLGVATAVAMSGDTTINNTGAVTISNDAVTTAKILNSNVTYAKIQNVAATRLLGNSTGSPAAPEEITLGTNLSFTGTTLNAAGGGYKVLTATISADTTLTKTMLAGANIYYVKTNNSTLREITLSSATFNQNDSVEIQIADDSPGPITIIYGIRAALSTTGQSYRLIKGSGATEWFLTLIPFAYNNQINSNGNLVLGNGASGGGLLSAGNTALNARITGSTSVGIGSGVQGSGANIVLIGNSINSSTNTGVVAIGQGITTTNTDAVIIGRAASAGGAANVTIGALSTGTGANTVRIGNTAVTNNATSSVAIGQGVTIGTGGANVVAIGQGVNTGLNTGVVAIGQGITSSNIDAVVIGRAAVGNQQSISIGALSGSGGGTPSVSIGFNAVSNKSYQFVKGKYGFPKHYGAESRRLGIYSVADDTVVPSRHNDNTAWIGVTANATPNILNLFDSGELLTLQDNEAMHFDIMITAKRNGSTNTFITRIAGGAVRGAGVGTTSIVGQTTLYTHGTALTAVVSADTVSGAVQLQVTGVAAQTWEWTCYVEYQRTRTA